MQAEIAQRLRALADAVEQGHEWFYEDDPDLGGCGFVFDNLLPALERFVDEGTKPDDEIAANEQIDSTVVLLSSVGFWAERQRDPAHFNTRTLAVSPDCGCVLFYGEDILERHALAYVVDGVAEALRGIK